MKALAFGEVLWDIIAGEAHLGGATFNCAAHLCQLGASAAFLSSVGDDELGGRVYSEARRLGMDTALISVNRDFPTGTVDVSVDEHGSPNYVIHENTAWDAILLSPAGEQFLARTEWDLFIYGTLAQRSDSNRLLLARVLDLVSPRIFFYDVNLRQNFHQRDWIDESLRRCNVVKLNEEEALSLFGPTSSLDELCRNIAESYEIGTVIITRGAAGALLFDGEATHVTEASQVEVSDTVGAGDSFSAGFLFALLSGLGVFAAGDFAAKLADFVVSRRGAIPEYPAALRAEIERITRTRR